MIIREVYVDAKGKVHKKLVHIYSDLGVRLLQEDTGIIYPPSVIDSINAVHKYRELTEDLGDLPEELKEPDPEAEELEELAALPLENNNFEYDA